MRKQIMNYEIAKQLKDAGFPQVLPKPDFLELHDAVAVADIYAKYPDNFDPYRPTLSELIEACGDKISSIVKIGIGSWGAYSVRGTLDNYIYESSDTPEEAVAKLWLALNKK